MNMKNIYKIISSVFVMFLFVGCAENFSDTNEFAKNVAPPSNVSAAFDKVDTIGVVVFNPSCYGKNIGIEDDIWR